MFKLAQKKKDGIARSQEAAPSNFVPPHIRLLTQEVPELGKSLPSSCKLLFPDQNDLAHFKVVVQPSDGYWRGGTFVFLINVPPEYNYMPPICTCATKIWHPNIDESGKICISILREPIASQTDGWTPARRLSEVIWAIDWLFDKQGLLNFSDPLNSDAADMYRRNADEFARKVNDYIRRYASIKS